MNAAPHPLCGWLISEAAELAIERAQHAASLLASLDADTAYSAAIEPGDMAAIADYIGRDLRDVLADATYIRPSTLTRCGGTDQPDTLAP